MGWIIGSAILICCLAVPLLIRMVQRRRLGTAQDEASQQQSKEADGQ